MRAYNRAGESQFNIRLEDEWQHSVEPDAVDEFGSMEMEYEFYSYLDDEWRASYDHHDAEYGWYDDAGYDWRDEQWRDEGWYEPHARYRNEYWCQYEYGPQAPSVEPDHASYWQEYLRRNQAATCVVFYGSPGVYPAA